MAIKFLNTVAVDTDVLYVDASSNNVGIGTTSPNAKLDIQGTQGQLFSVTDDLSGSIFAVSDISGVPIFDVNSSGVSYFDGNVGIGTKSPLTKLDILGTSDTYVTIRNTGGGNKAGILMYGGSAGISHIWHDDIETNPPGIHFGTSANVATAPTTQMYIEGSSGNVGIGTTSPNRSLHVVGQIALDNSASSPSAGMLISVDSASNKIYSRTANNNSTPLPFEIVSGSSSSLYINSNGNVGIGTTSPIGKLNIQQSSLDVPSLFIGRFNAENIPLLQIGESDYFTGGTSYGETLIHSSNRDIVISTASTQTFADVNSAVVTIKKANGNVGIGTTNPSEKLEVAGNARITGDVTLSNGNALRWTSDDVRIEGTTAGDNIKFYVANTEILQLAQSGTLATVTGNLRVTGAYYDSNNSAGTSGQVLSSTATGTDWVSLSEISGVDGTGTTNYVAKWSDTDTITDSVIYDDGTNVGIGTTSPDTTLTVKTGTSAGIVKISSDGNGARYSANGDVQLFTNNSAYSINFFSANKAGNLMRILDNGNVGIGTTSPSQKLEVIGDDVSGPSITWKQTNRRSGYLYSDSAGVGIYDTALNNAGIYLANNSRMDFRVNGSERMRIDSSGNVGIGTTSPSSFYPGSNNLVVGSGTGDKAITVYAGDTSTAYYLFAKGTIGADRYHGQVRYNFNADTMEFIAGGSTSSKFTIKSTGVLQVPSLGQGFLQTDSSGNISTSGGGTLPGGPYLPLSAGSGYPLTGELFLQSDLTIDNATGDPYIKLKTVAQEYVLRIDQSDSEKFQIRDTNNSATRLTIDTSGNVGIGTTSPTKKLDIVSTNSGSQIQITSPVPGIKLIDSNLTTRYAEIKAENGNVNIDIDPGQAESISYFSVDIDNSEKFRINKDGNVGIGVTSPGAKLDIVGSSLGIRVKKADLSDVLRVYTQGSGIFMDNGNVHISDDLKIGATLLSNQENTDIDSAAAEVVAQVAHATYTAAFFDFVVKKGTNVRSGTVYACHNGDTTPLVEFTETSTNDLGDTSDVTLSVDISGGNMRLLATVTSDDWTVKSLIRAI